MRKGINIGGMRFKDRLNCGAEGSRREAIIARLGSRVNHFLARGDYIGEGDPQGKEAPVPVFQTHIETF